MEFGAMKQLVQTRLFLSDSWPGPSTPIGFTHRFNSRGAVRGIPSLIVASSQHCIVCSDHCVFITCLHYTIHILGSRLASFLLKLVSFLFSSVQPFVDMSRSGVASHWYTGWAQYPWFPFCWQTKDPVIFGIWQAACLCRFFFFLFVYLSYFFLVFFFLSLFSFFQLYFEEMLFYNTHTNIKNWGRKKS